MRSRRLCVRECFFTFVHLLFFRQAVTSASRQSRICELPTGLTLRHGGSASGRDRQWRILKLPTGSSSGDRRQAGINRISVYPCLSVGKPARRCVWRAACRFAWWACPTVCQCLLPSIFSPILRIQYWFTRLLILGRSTSRLLTIRFTIV